MAICLGNVGGFRQIGKEIESPFNYPIQRTKNIYRKLLLLFLVIYFFLCLGSEQIKRLQQNSNP